MKTCPDCGHSMTAHTEKVPVAFVHASKVDPAIPAPIAPLPTRDQLYDVEIFTCSFCQKSFFDATALEAFAVDELQRAAASAELN